MFISNIFEHNDQEGLKRISKLLALNVRNELEDFHVKYIPDKLMPELNRTIRHGIYNALFVLANLETDQYCAKYFDALIRRVPDYWEDPELLAEFEKVLSKFDSEIHFESEFLREQYKLGNIQRLPNSNTLIISPAYDFKGVDYDLRKKHRNKIRVALGKEDFKYDQVKDAYIKKG